MAKQEKTITTYTFRGMEVELRKQEYRMDGTLAVMMVEAETKEPYGCVTVNLGNPIQSRELAFVDENNLPGIAGWLEKNGIALPMGYLGRSGFCTYPLMMFIK